MPRYTRDVGRKFNQDLSVRPFPGNTIICFVDPRTHPTIYNEALWAQQRLQGMHCAHKFGFLPPSSFHMTVMELLTDADRNAEKWSAKLPLDMPLEETDHFLIETLKACRFPETFAMQFDHMGEQASLKLSPANEESHAAIWAFREEMADLTGVRRTAFADYVFHITLGYNLIELEPHDVAERDATFLEIDERLTETFGIFETDQPVLTFFDDMFKFVSAHARLSLHTRSR